ncbi:phage tail tape measure protein [Lamprocystis purpurea]|jgi:TP901 family phage tail tape measure protein|uniref:phage tail tape measure protein n=1 Tax=Lamprocystis purpurea TaxID=61598 RepID=UPI00037A2518|nr:phage tail tape measure protein [Lamprocystis purpurea]
MSSALTLGIIVSLVDRASGPARTLAANLDAIGVKAGALAAGLAAGMAPMIRAYADLDEGATRLRATLMDSSGTVPETFKGLSAEALRLGTLLPGTTNDFYRMFDVMLSGGTAAKAILEGQGEATAYLAVVTKQSYEATAQSVTNLGASSGVAAKDMMPFLDVIQRATKIGSSVADMEMTFARSAAGIKATNIQGLEASQSLTVLYSMLNKITNSAEVTGTAFGSMLMKSMDRGTVDKVNKGLKQFGITLDFVDKKTGKHKGLEHFMAQLEKLRKLNPEELLKVLNDLFGADSGISSVGGEVVKIGASGLAAGTAEYAKQANLQQRVKEILGDTKNIWGSLMGTIETVAALLAGPLVEWAKPLLNDLNAVIGKVGTWVQANERLVLIGGQIAAGLVAAGAAIAGIALTAKTLGFLFGGKGGQGGQGAPGGGLLDAATGVVKVFVTNPGWGGSAGGGDGGPGASKRWGTGSVVQNVALTLSAGALGYAIGTVIYERWCAGTNLGDVIGETIARALAPFGVKSAQEALTNDPTPGDDDQWFGPLKLRERRARSDDPQQGWHPKNISLVDLLAEQFNGLRAKLPAGLGGGAAVPTLGPPVAPLTPDPAAAQAQTAAAQTQATAAQTQSTAAQQHGTAAQTQQQAAEAAQSAANTMQSAANQLQNINGTITVRVTGPAQVTGVSATGPVEIAASADQRGPTMGGN